MIKLHDHQERALRRLSNGKILWGGVGSGKTITAIFYYLRNETPKDIYVITTARKRDEQDWQLDFLKVGVGPEPGPAGHGSLTVDSWNNLGRYRNVKGAFFIFDEQRLVGSGSWSKIFLDIAKGNNWIMLSATPGDNWLDYIPVFVANGFYKNRTAFKREHVVYNTFTKFPKVDRYVGVGRLVRLRQQLLVEMPFDRHTVRHPIDIHVDHDESTFEKVLGQRWHVYENRPLRDAAELFSVMRKVVNSDSSRIAAVRTLMETHGRLIVFYNFDYELEMLRELKWQTNSPVSTESSALESQRDSKASATASAAALTSPGQNCSEETSTSTTSTTTSWSKFQLAEWNGHNHDPVPATERWVYLVQYVAGAEAWNCVTTNAICFYSLPYSYKIWEQAHGRIDRLNTIFRDLFYHRLLSNSVIDKIIARSLDQKKSFNEGKYAKEKFGGEKI